MVTIRDVSIHSGVSQATVSRVLNGTSRVSHDKKLKVEKAIQELGYKHNSIVHALSSNRSGSIGIVVPELTGQFYPCMLQSMENCLRKLGYHAVITTGSDEAQGQREAIEFLISRRVDALVLHTSAVSDDYLIELASKNIPLAIVNRYVPELNDSCIEIDNETGGKAATEYLISQGHTQIACITGPLSRADARARLLGYRSALEAAGLNYSEPLIVEAGYTEESGVSAIRKLFKRNIEFSAVFACNDNMAFGVAEEIKNSGLTVPGDLSLVGFDNTVLARYMSPALTTINFPLERMSLEAVQMIIQKLNKNPQEVTFKLLPSLIIRNSVQPVAT